MVSCSIVSFLGRSPVSGKRHGMLSVIATGLTLLGTLLVLCGLYRRDPAAQRRARQGWGWFASRVLRRSQPPAEGSGAISLVVTVAGEGMTPPLKAQSEAPIEERVARLEENIEILSGSIRSQAEARRKGGQEVRARVKALADAVDGEIAALRRLADEASVPERMEWWGVGFLVLGSILALMTG